MPKKVKCLLFFITIFAGAVLIAGNQVWAQCADTGNFAEAIFDSQFVKIIYDPCTGDVLATCGRNEGYTDPVCGENWEAGTLTTRTIRPTPTSAARLITNVGPGTGCVCYGSCEVYVRGKCYVVPCP